MKVAILSDSHDHLFHLQAVLDDVKSQQAEVLLHLGDLCAPFVVAELARQFPGPIHIIEGNNDGDQRLIAQVAANHPQIKVHGLYVELDLEGCSIALIHYPEPARRIAESGVFDLVAYGHDHKAFQEQSVHGWLVNPGEVMGRFGQVGWGLFDTISQTYEHRLVIS